MQHKVPIEPLTQQAFAPYGKVVDLPESDPSKAGDGWDCWSYIQMLDVHEPIGFGLVVTRRREFVVSAMERHVSREELLLAFDREIIQPVARCIDIDDPQEHPDPSTVKCFRIKPGQAIVIHRGVWHSPAYPASDDARYMFGIEKKKDKFGDEMIRPWVDFIGGDTIRFE
ncbi:ureidoglycolate lyase [Paenibacillus doosanensis]|uniref:ureidoglycolate lyase n=1 Tax=Paenibacillus doosanensis TaxID=1229154 RepID=UPI00217F661A|nr:ureidoglycolate lyase [Paenibacillus doosanensis]MCS7464532.1 ureidoglycolate lyase [Paenibacillus doosanensis]